MAQKVIILRGLPGSGKSTWAKEKLRKGGSDWKRICRDDLRGMLDNYAPWDFDIELFQLSARDILIEHALLSGYNVIIDDLHVNPDNIVNLAHLLRRIRAASDHKIIASIKFFDIPVEECIKRDSQRGLYSVGEKFIRHMSDRYLQKRIDVSAIINCSDNKKVDKVLKV